MRYFIEGCLTQLTRITRQVGFVRARSCATDPCVLAPDSPLLNLSLGSNLDADGIREGDDVYFECDVSARPPVDTIHWKLNVSGLVSMGLRLNVFVRFPIGLDQIPIAE